jgi:hypothetical protein
MELVMTTLSPEVVGQSIAGKGKSTSPSGVDCYFVKIDDKWGVKVYFLESTRDRGYRNQKEMAKYGLAPEVGPTLNVGMKYCYITEIIEPLVLQHKDEEYDAWVNELRRLQYNPGISRAIRETVERMEKKGWYMMDDHPGNFGYKNKMLMCLDFAE